MGNSVKVLKVHSLGGGKLTGFFFWWGVGGVDRVFFVWGGGELTGVFLGGGESWDPWVWGEPPPSPPPPLP